MSLTTLFTHAQTASLVALIVGYAAAHAAGLLTKAHAPQWVLGAVTIALSTLAGVLLFVPAVTISVAVAVMYWPTV